jgi:hypothetical protein
MFRPGRLRKLIFKKGKKGGGEKQESFVTDPFDWKSR